jgi:hypothetical protein
VKKLRELSEEDLVELAWLPENVGRALHARLHSGSPAPGGRP